MSVEKRVLTEFLQLYKEFSCLWDNKEVLYSNKEARDKAYEVLLEKYRQVQEDASIMDVKKKIEYMRTTYRREHKKVLLSRLNGDVEEYVPTLWYYDHLTFLNDVADFSRLEPVPRDSNAEVSLKVEYDEPKSKKRKSSSLSTIYLPERHYSNDEDNDDDFPNNHENENNSLASIQANMATEAEAFGTTIGFQLKELDPMQRVIAEKLISDVIFNARLNRLTVNSSIGISDKIITPSF